MCQRREKGEGGKRAGKRMRGNKDKIEKLYDS